MHQIELVVEAAEIATQLNESYLLLFKKNHTTILFWIGLHDARQDTVDPAEQKPLLLRLAPCPPLSVRYLP